MVRPHRYLDADSDDEESQVWSDSPSEDESRGASRNLVGAWFSAIFFVAFVVGAVAVLVLSLRGSRAAERATARGMQQNVYRAAERATARSMQQNAIQSELLAAPSTAPLAPLRSEARLRRSSLPQPDAPAPPVDVLAAGLTAVDDDQGDDTIAWGQRYVEEEFGAAPAEASFDAPLVLATPPTPHCGENEEMLAGLCYRKCSLLTDGKFPQRWASNACHRDAAEGREAMTKYEGLAACLGFNVGDEEQCPHAPFIGSCDVNEELHAGACYKKCVLLTKGEFKVRSGSNTCCEDKACTTISRSKASGVGCQGFGVGGGSQPGHECAHPPEVP